MSPDCIAEDCEEEPVEEQLVADGSVDYGVQPLCATHARMNDQPTVESYDQ